MPYRTSFLLSFLLPGAVMVIAAGCATAISPADCGTGVAALDARAPRNFGEVLTKDGKPTGVYRGGELTNCNETAFLRQQRITHILQLNASRAAAAQGKRRQGDFDVLPLHFSAFTVGNADTCNDVRSALAYLADPDNRPVYVHCSAGRDRTGYVVGMFERMDPARSFASVMKELEDFGHHGLWSLLFGQIDRQLASRDPVCK